MQCFKRRETAAIAICMSCGVALCGDCTRRGIGQRIVCSAFCSEQLGQLFQSSSEGHDRAARSNAVSAGFVWLLGAGLLLYVAYSVLVQKTWDFAVYGVSFGIVCFGIGFFYNALAKRTPNRSLQPDAPPSGGAPRS